MVHVQGHKVRCFFASVELCFSDSTRKLSLLYESGAKAETGTIQINDAAIRRVLRPGRRLVMALMGKSELGY